MEASADLQNPFQVTPIAQLHHDVYLGIILIYTMQANDVTAVLYGAHDVHFLPDLLHGFLLQVEKALQNVRKIPIMCHKPVKLQS